MPEGVEAAGFRWLARRPHPHTGSSQALHHLVTDCNRGRTVLWVREIDELEAKLAVATAPPG